MTARYKKEGFVKASKIESSRGRCACRSDAGNPCVCSDTLQGSTMFGNDAFYRLSVDSDCVCPDIASMHLREIRAGLGSKFYPTSGDALFTAKRMVESWGGKSLPLP